MQKVTTSAYKKLRLKLNSVFYNGPGLSRNIKPKLVDNSYGQSILGLIVKFPSDLEITVSVNSTFSEDTRLSKFPHLNYPEIVSEAKVTFLPIIEPSPTCTETPCYSTIPSSL